MLADLALAIAILSALAVIGLRLNRAEPLIRSGAVVVVDGDTLSFAGERVRLRGIDAPERGQTCMMEGTSYPCGERAGDALRQMVAGRSVHCEGGERDRYGRLLAICKVGDRELNAALVENGWAVAFGGYHAQEAEARAAGRGLWAGEFEMPQAWRRIHGRLDETAHDALDGAIRRFLRYLGFG